MIIDNKKKIFSMSGISFIAKIHDDNFASITMNGLLKIFSGKKPFNCLKKKQITKTTELYNLKEIFLQNSNNSKIYLFFYAKDILIYSFENNYQECFLIQKIINNNYIGALFQLNNKDIIFWDKKNTINILPYINQNKNIFLNTINQLKNENKSIKTYIISFIEYDNNNIVTTSTTKHPLGENVIRLYKIEYAKDKIAKLLNIKNFSGYACAIFESNIIKMEKQKNICIALNYYVKNGIIFNNSAILFINYEYLEITTILELNYSVNNIFSFSLISNKNNYKIKYDYVLLSQFKSEDNNNIKKKGSSNYRFIDFYSFEPKNVFDPLLIDDKRINTNSTIDITNSFILNKNNLVLFQTDQINIYYLSIK